MSEIGKEFEIASQDVQKLAQRPDHATLLELYALYKQGTFGDVTGKRPGFTNLTGRAKFDAWSKLSGTSKDEAMKQYIALVKKLKTKTHSKD